ncbi:MAG: sugar nucleotide-binding protein, partial [Acidimicrobiales bacterium]
MLLVIGGDSLIGGAVTDRLRARGALVASTTRRPDLCGPNRPLVDLGHPPPRWQLPSEVDAACLCAAVARLSACADDPFGSARVNVAATTDVALRLVAKGAHVVFLSSNQVFDGSRPDVPAGESPSPVSEYGRQKVRAERALTGLSGHGGGVAILRLSKVVGPRWELLDEWARLLAGGQPVEAFTDMRLAPVPVASVAS